MRPKGKSWLAFVLLLRCAALPPQLTKTSSLDDAEALLSKGKNQEALLLLTDYVREQPFEPRGYILLGLAYSQSGQREKAAESLRRAVALAPRSVAAHLNLGVQEALLGNSEAAKAEFQRVLQLDPAKKEALFNLGKLSYGDGEYASAAQYLKKYLSWGSEQGALVYLLRSALKLNDGETVEKTRQEIARLAPQDAALHAQIACWLAESRDSSAAQKEFELVTALAPEAYLYAQLGQCYRQAGDQPKALAAYEKAIERDPNQEQYYIELAEILSSRDLAGPARDVMARAITRLPNSINIRVHMGLLELEGGNLAEALKVYQDASAIDSNSPAVLQLLGRIQMAQRSYPEAVATFERAARLAPGDAATHFYEGQAWMKMDDGSDRALESFTRSLQLDPRRAKTYYWLGSIYFHRKRDYRRAVEYLQQAVSRAPELEAAYQMLIEAYRLLGDEEKAAEEIRKHREAKQRMRSDLTTVEDRR